MKRNEIFFGGMAFVIIVLTLALSLAVMSGTGSEEHGLLGNELLGLELETCVLPDGQYYYWGDTWGGRGQSAGVFYYPSSIVIGPDNSVYVGDKSSQIKKLGTDGQWTVYWDGIIPAAMTIDGYGMIFVLEDRFNFQYLYAIEVIDGKVSVDSDRKIRCEIKYPSGMAISDRKPFAFYVTVANGLWLLEPRGEDPKLTNLQYPTGNPNRLSGPWGIAVGLNGDVYIADSDKNCIKVIYKNGTVDTWGSKGSGPGQFNQPKGLALDLDGNVYVADSGNDRIQMFDPDGVFLGSMGNSHSLNNPEALAVDSHYNVYVADTGNSRIRKLVLNQQRPA
jgi:DNA-binding beta-propeller fold protein YncE